MGTDASLFGRVKNKQNTYEEVSLSRYHWLTIPDILTFCSSSVGLYFRGTVPLHHETFNWESDFDKVLKQIDEALIYYQEEMTEFNEDPIENSEDIRIGGYKITQLENLKKSVLKYSPNWDCLIILPDSGCQLYDALVFENEEIVLTRLEIPL